MSKIKWPKDFSTWIGLVGLLGLAAYQASQRQFEMAFGTISVAMGILGLGANAATAASYARSADRHSAFAAADTAAIRNDPMMPGPAMTSAEHIERANNHG